MFFPVKIVTLCILLFTSSSYADSVTSLDHLLSLAYEKNPSLISTKNLVRAEESLVTSSATLDDPMIGISTLDRGMETQYGTISQKIRFPVKYALQAKAQSSEADSYKASLSAEKLLLRQKVSTLYFDIYAIQKTIQLTKANMESVKEFARVAEKKYAAGESPQSDSMKAHFELTQLELELIRLRQQEDALQEQMKAVVGVLNLSNINFSSHELPSPKFFESRIELDREKLSNKLVKSSPLLKRESHKLKAAEYKSSLSKWEYAPDVQLQYQKRISGSPEDSQIFSVGITFPLWFWKKGSEASAASSRRIAQEYRLIDTQRKLMADVIDLKGKVQTSLKTIKIYETSLIPQAQGAYNSSRSSYQANRTSFLDLLDSERSLYRVKTGYYQSLKQYVSSLSKLETQLGYLISDLGVKSEAIK